MNTDSIDQKAVQLAFDKTQFGVNRKELDAMGERAVRDALHSGKYGHSGIATFAFVSAWLADAEFARIAASSAKRDAREENISLLASRANLIAYSALIIAAIAAHKEIRWLISSVISLFSS